jgi:hypothetical protein
MTGEAVMERAVVGPLAMSCTAVDMHTPLTHFLPRPQAWRHTFTLSCCCCSCLAPRAESLHCASSMHKHAVTRSKAGLAMFCLSWTVLGKACSQCREGCQGDSTDSVPLRSNGFTHCAILYATFLDPMHKYKLQLVYGEKTNMVWSQVLNQSHVRISSGRSAVFCSLWWRQLAPAQFQPQSSDDIFIGEPLNLISCS